MQLARLLDLDHSDFKKIHKENTVYTQDVDFAYSVLVVKICQSMLRIDNYLGHFSSGINVFVDLAKQGTKCTGERKSRKTTGSS